MWKSLYIGLPIIGILKNNQCLVKYKHGFYISFAHIYHIFLGDDFMLNSNERMDYICGYLAAYENKIKMANKQGLFDAAKMFELFAANVCTLWFGQSFKNLNTDTSTYPYVDLISEDQKQFVQVTTTLDLVTKVKTTLEKLRDSKDPRVSNLKNVVFFVLHNQNVDRVPDYTGSGLIGNVPFTRKDNLISTQDILARAQNDLDFQLQLYDLFKADESNTSRNEELFKAALDSTATVGLMNINCYLSGGYQIDRTALVEKVKSENYRFISIQGTAGSGKSAFCKLLVDGQELVLYARSERFIEESNLNDIWSLDIEKILIYLNGRKLTFFIDALEFIADCRQNNLKLLILDLLLYKGPNGLIAEIAHQAKDFLSDNEKLARSMLNTIMMLAKDEMDHQKYNADYLENHLNTSGIKFVPNVTPKLSGVDRQIIQEGNGQGYTSQRDAIVAEYLYGEQHQSNTP